MDEMDDGDGEGEGDIFKSITPRTDGWTCHQDRIEAFAIGPVGDSGFEIALQPFRAGAVAEIPHGTG